MLMKISETELDSRYSSGALKHNNMSTHLAFNRQRTSILCDVQIADGVNFKSPENICWLPEAEF